MIKVDGRSCTCLIFKPNSEVPLHISDSFDSSLPLTKFVLVFANEFDIVAFNLSAELTYTNVLNMLDLGLIPLHADARGVDDPIVLAGGHCTYNPEPLADFLDAVVLGEGEEVVSEITDVVGAWKADPSRDRASLLKALAGVEGVYVPSLYAPRFEGCRQVGLDLLAISHQHIVDCLQSPSPLE